MQHTEVEKVDDSPSTFICTLILVTDNHVHQTGEQRISRKPSRNCARNFRGEIPSYSPYALKRRARVCPHDPAAYFLDSRLLDSEIARLKKTDEELRDKLAEYQRIANQEKDDLNETINSLRADLHTCDNSSSVLRIQLTDAQRKADGINHALEQLHKCESLYAQGRIQGAAECLLELVNTVNDDVRANKFIVDSLTGGFRRRASA